MFDRARTALAYTKQAWADDPAARGAGKIGAGGLLVADAVFNLRGRVGNAVRPHRHSSDRPTGILGSLLGVLVGVAILLVGFTIRPSWSDAAVTTTGEVVEVVESVRPTDDGPERTYRGVIAFSDELGREHEFTESIGSGSPPRIGSAVEVTYEPASPGATAQRTDGFAGRIHWAVIGVGALIFILTLADLAMRVAMIVVGIWLIRSGRRDRAAAGEKGRLLVDLRRLVWEAKRELDAQTDAINAVEGGPGAPEPSLDAGPPPGWYASPGGSSGDLRWWDGTRWTEHRSGGGVPDHAEGEGWGV